MTTLHPPFRVVGVICCLLFTVSLVCSNNKIPSSIIREISSLQDASQVHLWIYFKDKPNTKYLKRLAGTSSNSPLYPSIFALIHSRTRPHCDWFLTTVTTANDVHSLVGLTPKAVERRKKACTTGTDYTLSLFIYIHNTLHRC